MRPGHFVYLLVVACVVLAARARARVARTYGIVTRSIASSDVAARGHARFVDQLQTETNVLQALDSRAAVATAAVCRRCVGRR